jgi:hypothetical protein
MLRQSNCDGELSYGQYLFPRRRVGRAHLWVDDLALATVFPTEAKAIRFAKRCKWRKATLYETLFIMLGFTKTFQPRFSVSSVKPRFTKFLMRLRTSNPWKEGKSRLRTAR